MPAWAGRRLFHYIPNDRSSGLPHCLNFLWGYLAIFFHPIRKFDDLHSSIMLINANGDCQCVVYNSFSQISCFFRQWSNQLLHRSHLAPILNVDILHLMNLGKTTLVLCVKKNTSNTRTAPTNVSKPSFGVDIAIVVCASRGGPPVGKTGTTRWNTGNNPFGRPFPYLCMSFYVFHLLFQIKMSPIQT